MLLCYWIALLFAEKSPASEEEQRPGRPGSAFAALWSCIVSILSSVFMDDQSQRNIVPGNGQELSVQIPVASVSLAGDLSIPADSRGVVLFAHGSGSSRHSPRNRYVARVLQEAGIATLLFDLLTRDEEALDMRTAGLRFDIGLLAERLVEATDWLTQQPQIEELKIAYCRRPRC
jgi:hypothetical protein